MPSLPVDKEDSTSLSARKTPLEKCQPVSPGLAQNRTYWIVVVAAVVVEHWRPDEIREEDFEKLDWWSKSRQDDWADSVRIDGIDRSRSDTKLDTSTCSMEDNCTKKKEDKDRHYLIEQKITILISSLGERETNLDEMICSHECRLRDWPRYLPVSKLVYIQSKSNRSKSNERRDEQVEPFFREDWKCESNKPISSWPYP